jgi:putative flippase GtrA
MRLERIPSLIRFAVVGGLCALLQLGFLETLVIIGMEKNVANFVALLASAQVNFFLSHSVTWAERRIRDEKGSRLLDKLARFNGLIAVSVLVNQLTFAVAVSRIHYLLAAVLGILAAASINFFVSDRLIFVAQGTRTGPTA